MEYDWPGNVRELQNVVERALILNPKGPISFNDINIPLKVEKKVISNKRGNDTIDNLDEVIANHIYKMLEKTEGKIHGPGGAAELMGINPSTLRNKIRKLKIDYSKS
jgi:DNA-binding NtrC family response regulator